MSLVFAGVCSHAPGITGRRHMADPDAARPDAIIVVAAEHFANFFMDNMPAYCIGMAPDYEGPIEDPEWIGIARTKIPGNPELSKRIIESVLQRVDVAYAEEWKFDHGIIVPLNFLTPQFNIPIIPVNINCQGPPLTPLHRATGGISHWPATPDSGKINEAWDREFLDHFVHNRKEQMLSYTDDQTYRDAGQGGFEIRTFITVAGATEGSSGEIHYYRPIPIFAVGCTVATMQIDAAA